VRCETKPSRISADAFNSSMPMGAKVKLVTPASPRNFRHQRAVRLHLVLRVEQRFRLHQKTARPNREVGHSMFFCTEPLTGDELGIFIFTHALVPSMAEKTRRRPEKGRRAFRKGAGEIRS